MTIEENISTVNKNTYKYSIETVSNESDSKNKIIRNNINRKIQRIAFTPTHILYNIIATKVYNQSEIRKIQININTNSSIYSTITPTEKEKRNSVEYITKNKRNSNKQMIELDVTSKRDDNN